MSYLEGTIHERLSALFEGLRPAFEDDGEPEHAGDRMLARDPAVWLAVQEHRQRKYAEEQARREAAEVMEALQEAEQALSGFDDSPTWETLRQRLDNPEQWAADYATAHGPQEPNGETPAQRQERHAAARAANDEAFDASARIAMAGAMAPIGPAGE